MRVLGESALWEVCVGVQDELGRAALFVGAGAAAGVAGGGGRVVRAGTRGWGVTARAM